MKNEKFVMTKDAALKFFTAKGHDADLIKSFLDELVEDMLNNCGSRYIINDYRVTALPLNFFIVEKLPASYVARLKKRYC